MIRPGQIPDEVVDAADAAQRAYPDYDQRGSIRAAIAAAINAWPGSCNVACTMADLLLLHIPQEKSDE